MSERKRLVENFARDWNNNVLPLQVIKENRIVEAEGKEYNVDKKYIVPVWRTNESNLNGRKYPLELAERIVKESPKTVNLADHPQDEGSVRDIIAVSMNPFIQDGVMYVESYFVDEEFEKKLDKMLEKGVGMGVSSSGFGEVDKDGRVDESSFELDRFWDAVNSPSFQVFITQESIASGITKESTESHTTNNSQLISDTDTNKVETTTNSSNSGNSVTLDETETHHNEEKNRMSTKDENKKLSLEERNLRMGARNLLKEAEAQEDLYDKRQTYTEVLEYCDGAESAQEFIEQANEAIQTIDKQLHELADKGKEADSLKESKQSLEEQIKEKDEEISKLQKQVEQLTEKYEMAADMLDDSKERDKKLKEMYQVAVAERNGMVKASEYRELYSFKEQVEEELDSLKEENRKLKRKLRRRTQESSEDEDTPRRSRRRFSETSRRSRRKDEDVDEEDSRLDEDADSEEEDDEEDYDKDEFSSPNFEAIKEYYEDLAAYNPQMKKIKKEILSSKTLMEAQRTYLKYKDLVEDLPAPGSRKFELNEEEGSTEIEYSTSDRKPEPSLIERAINQRGYV